MSSVAEAQSWAKALVTHESRGPGDLDGAMHRLESRYGIPWRTFWALRYRPPKQIGADVWKRIRQAHQYERQRQLRLLEHETEITAAINPQAHSVAAVKAALDEVDVAITEAIMKNRVDVE